MIPWIFRRDSGEARARAAWVLVAHCSAFLLGSFIHPAPANAQVAPPVAVDTSDEEAVPKPVTGFSVKKEDNKVNDLFADFNRYRDKKAWEVAFRSLGQLGEQELKGMVPSKDGFFISSRQRLWESLTSLPPEGKEAYRLFNDAKAKQLFEQVESADPSAAGSAGDDTATPQKI